jgi:hypothetical protein
MAEKKQTSLIISDCSGEDCFVTCDTDFAMPALNEKKKLSTLAAEETLDHVRST